QYRKARGKMRKLMQGLGLALLVLVSACASAPTLGATDHANMVVAAESDHATQVTLYLLCAEGGERRVGILQSQESRTFTVRSWECPSNPTMRVVSQNDMVQMPVQGQTVRVT